MATGTHRKPAEKAVTLPRIPVGLILIGAFLLMLTVGLVVALVYASHAQPAGQTWQAQAARVVVAEETAVITPYQADTATCRDFFTYLHHPTGSNFTRMYRESRHADTYLRVDVALWNSDRKHRKPKAVLRADRGFVHLDCTTSGD